ncbi:Nramp family divalent metal transporter [uncultured Pseudoteredinibacter sp.]|uniref:Nramp family divalent metal transporter n=1 Tax=uncultured Pseudoteredinibacter sp. TaxID=1641701 RepID=UPI002605E817|nr:Nramp family divalent metal transporter [uncultured Pseudoteredinibacter sp.]
MKKFGPGLLVAAAFIGPGTVATASKAGAGFGFALLWALLFSVFATIVLQEMAARLGLVTGKGLAEAVRSSFKSPELKNLSIFLIVAAIGLGNAAYQTGNIAGAALGINSAIELSNQAAAAIIALLAFALLASGQYKLIEKSLIALVVLMSFVFLLTLIWVGPDWAGILKGLFTPSIPDGSVLLVIALIGTTVVPYNLFLHASSVSKSFQESGEQDIDAALSNSRWDTGLSIGFGGLITLAIIATSATAFFGQSDSFQAAQLAQQLEPLLGPAAKYCFAIGMLAAGLTSAIAAPLAAAFAVCGALGWSTEFNNLRFRAVWFVVLLTGAIFAIAGTKPLAAIIFAQAANGLLLPLIAIFLLLAMNQEKLLGSYKNGTLANCLGGFVVVLVSCLGLYKLYSLF